MPDAGKAAEDHLQSRLSKLSLMPDAVTDAEVNMQSRLSGKNNTTYKIARNYDMRPFDAVRSAEASMQSRQAIINQKLFLTIIKKPRKCALIYNRTPRSNKARGAATISQACINIHTIEHRAPIKPEARLP